MKIVKKEIRLDHNIKLPFKSIEDAKKGIILNGMRYVNEGYDETLKFYMLDDGSKHYTFLITGLYEEDTDNKLKLDNFLCDIMENGKKIFLFIIKKDDEDFVDFSKKKFYRENMELTTPVRAKEK